MNPFIQKLLVLSIVGISIISSYMWVYPLTKKVTGKGKLYDCLEALEEIGKAIEAVGETGSPYEIELYVPGEIRIFENYIELKVKTNYPLVSQTNFLPLNTEVLPEDRKKISLVPYTSLNCTSVNCTWCLDKGCDIKEVKIGNFSDERFAIFWIQDRYASICFTNDTLDDNYLSIDENNCYYENEYYKGYRILLIDENGDYAILEGKKVRSVVLKGEKRTAIVAKTTGYKEYITEFRLYILDILDRNGVRESIKFRCKRGCWKESGIRKIYLELGDVTVEEGNITKFINVEVS